MPTRRGVSPLLSAVFLVAIGVAAAAIFSTFLTGFTRDQGSTIQNQSQDRIRCSYAALYIQDAEFDDTADAVRVTVGNSGSVDLANVSIYAFRDSQVDGWTWITNIAVGGSARTGTITYTAGTAPDTVRAISSQCPAVSDATSDISTP